MAAIQRNTARCDCGGTVLDPFTGSGTTGMACAAEGFEFIGIEREAEYVEIAQRRIASIAPLFEAAPNDEQQSAVLPIEDAQLCLPECGAVREVELPTPRLAEC